ncbi:hypothetical protein VKS41_000019 [Umbelopsis sp. WA50703]
MEVTSDYQALETDLKANGNVYSEQSSPTDHQPLEREFDDHDYGEPNDDEQHYVISKDRNVDVSDPLALELDSLSIDDTNESMVWRNSDSSPRDSDNKTSLTLKEQEKTIDELRKESFGLKLKCYFLEERLAQLSPGQMDEALRENIDLKVKMQTLVQELKKYKKMIVDLHGAIDILQQQNKQQEQHYQSNHGKTEHEREQLESALENANSYRFENESLHLRMAEQAAEIARLTDALCKNDHQHLSLDVERLVNDRSNALNELEVFKRNLAQARRVIHSLESQSSHKATDNTLFKTVLSERDALLSRNDHLTKVNYNLQEELSHVRDRNGDLINQLVEKDKEIDQLNGEIEELIEHHNSMIEDLDEHKSGLHQRGQDVDRLSKHNNELLARMNDIQESLRDEEAAHKDDVSRLSGELNEREKEIEDLDVQMENMIGFIEELEQGQKERDERIADLQKQLEQHVEEDRLYDQDVDLLESRFQQAEKAIQDKENIIKNLQDELDEKSENTQQYQVEIDGLNRQLKQMQKEMEKQLHRVKELEQTLVESAEQAQEAQTQHENDLQELDVRFQETENLVHERTRQNADLKHRLEVSETRGKEAKALYEKEMAQVKEALTNKISKIERAWTERVHGLEGRLKEAEQKSRRDRKAAHDKMNELVGNQLTLKDKLEAATKRNAPFSDKNDLKQTESEMELRRELERNVALFQSEQKRFQELDEEHEELLEAHEQLKRQLVRRDNMITKALERLEVSYSSMIECAVEGNGRGDITVMLRFNSWGWCKVQPQNVSFNQKWYFSFENASI